MASILKNNNVLYKCSCNEKRPITKIYFCRHCIKLRCSDCVSHEVDSHYCPNCLEYMPSPEARLKKNRCANCFDCPSCMHTLSIRASNVQVVNLEDPNKTTPKKVYYLVCGFCRWTSRDVGIPDQTVATGSWPDPENVYIRRINHLLEHYRAMAQQEKLDKERRKITQRTGYVNFSDKFGISAIVAKKLAGLSTSSGFKEEENKMEEPAPSLAVEHVEPFDESILATPVNLVSVCTIKQRLMQPEFQPNTTKEFYPRHKSLLIKKSQRCKGCEHNLSKPEYNPSSIKFKIQLTAFFHIVELRIKKIPELLCNEKARVVLTLCNPTNHVAHVSFIKLEDAKETGMIEMPECEFSILARDDTAEFDDVQDSGQAQRYDPNIVSFQKGNKIGFYASVTPQVEHGDVIVGLKMKQDFVNVVVQLQNQGENRDPQVVWLDHIIWLNFGPVTPTSSEA